VTAALTAAIDAAPVIFALMVALIPIGAIVHDTATPRRYRRAGTRH
jgi:hypothetical protein